MDLVKAQYRNDDIKEQAYTIAENTMKMLSVNVMMKDGEALPNFCKSAAMMIIRDMGDDIVRNINKTAKARGMTVSVEDLNEIMPKVDEVFVEEMTIAGRVGMLDVSGWWLRATMLGGVEAQVEPLIAAWSDNSLPVFKGFWDRLYKAVDGYVNGSLQLAMLYAA